MNFFQLLKHSANLWFQKGADQNAAAFAYFMPFALTPLIVISITLVGMIIGREDVIALLLKWGGLIDVELPLFMQNSLANFEGITASYAVPVLALLFFSTMIIFALNSLSAGLQELWGVEKYGLKNTFRRSGRAVLFVLVFQLYLVTTIIVNNALGSFSDFSGWSVFNLVAQLIFFASTTLLIAAGFGILPLDTLPFKSRLYGAMVATTLFLFTRSLVALHVATAPAPDIYGAARLIFVLLIWVYMSSCILYFGAAFTKAHALTINNKI
jgi:membrane protein